MTCSTCREARHSHSQLDGVNGHFHGESNHYNSCPSHALPALHPPLPPRTLVLVQSKHTTTITTPTPSHSAAALPPNFKINHCNRRRLPSLSARVLHPSQQHQLAAQRSNAFGPFVGRVLFNHSFIKLLLQRSSSRQQSHVPCMQGVISDLFYYYYI